MKRDISDLLRPFYQLNILCVVCAFAYNVVLTAVIYRYLGTEHGGILDKDETTNL